jgi:hypothetical protein
MVTDRHLGHRSKFDIAKECRNEAGVATDIDRCSSDETMCRLKTQWAQFGGVDKRECVGESSMGGFTSFRVLIRNTGHYHVGLVCLSRSCAQIANDRRSRGSFGVLPAIRSETRAAPAVNQNPAYQLRQIRAEPARVLLVLVFVRWRFGEG